MAIVKRKDGVSDVHVTYNGALREYMCLNCAIMRANLEEHPVPNHTGDEICATVYAMHYHLRVHARRGHLVDKSAFRKLEKHMNRERKTDVTIGRKLRRVDPRKGRELRRAQKMLKLFKKGELKLTKKERNALRVTAGESTPSESASNGTSVSSGQ